ncbi:TspO/MBR family protein [uncultured Parvibaculum sp.]|uniref:TspO/MBR family protein n=1 Tax=uncultured Parvibaculum sp. TaxID=291828 RepID=UPI0030D8964A
MTSNDPSPDNKARPGPGTLMSLVCLFGFLIVVFIVAGAGGAVTATSVGDWYQELVKPPLNPDEWVFPVVWNFLYFLMAISAWLVWRAAGSFDKAGGPLSLFGMQLALNLSWSIVFFGLKSPALAVLVVLALDAAIILMVMAFLKFDRLAGLLQLPYLAWTLFATYLTVSIALLN